MENFSPFKFIFHITAKIIFLNEKFDVTSFLWSFLFDFRIKSKLFSMIFKVIFIKNKTKQKTHKSYSLFQLLLFLFYSFYSRLIFKYLFCYFSLIALSSFVKRTFFSFVWQVWILSWHLSSCINFHSPWLDFELLEGRYYKFHLFL